MSNYHDFRSILGDDNFDSRMRLVRLQGFRDDEAEQALRSTVGGRLGPAVCGAGALLGVALESPLLLSVLAVAAAIGVVAASVASSASASWVVQPWPTPSTLR